MASSVTNGSAEPGLNWTNLTQHREYMDLEIFLEQTLGPRRLSLNWLVPVTSVYAAIFCTGLVGNVLTCLVIRRNQDMQTATNFYLFNLAVAGMLNLLFNMPLELYSLWHQYPWQLGTATCVLRSVVAEATVYASVLTIATFSCQQYVAVCHSFHSSLSRSNKLSLAVWSILVIWAVSFAAAAPYGFYTRVNYLTVEPGGPEVAESAWCGFPLNAPTRQWETLMLCSTFLFFVAPMALVSLLYARICLALCRASLEHRERMQSRKVVIRMLFAVAVAFFVCWAPYHSQRLLFLYVSHYGEWTLSLIKINQDLFLLVGCFYNFNSSINPVLYSVMSQRFRAAFRKTFCADNPVLCCSSQSSSQRIPQPQPQP